MRSWISAIFSFGVAGDDRAASRSRDSLARSRPGRATPPTARRTRAARRRARWMKYGCFFFWPGTAFHS